MSGHQPAAGVAVRGLGGRRDVHADVARLPQGDRWRFTRTGTAFKFVTAVQTRYQIPHRYLACFMIASEAFSAVISTVKAVPADTGAGMVEASTTKIPSVPIS